MFKAVDDTFNDTQWLVVFIAKKFHTHYGGILSDLVSEAQYLWVVAYDTHEPSQDFVKHLNFKIWTGLLSYRRANARRNCPTKLWARKRWEALRWRNKYALEGTHVVDKSHKFNLKQFIEELSNDAQEVLGLIFDPPLDVRWPIQKMGRETPFTIKKAVLEYLNDLGWTTKRISETFQDIKEALE